jgi:hypothetical protein
MRSVFLAGAGQEILQRPKARAWSSGSSRQVGDYLFCANPKYARAPATRTPSQLTQNGMLKPPISTCHPKIIRSRCIIATIRNSAAVTVI